MEAGAEGGGGVAEEEGVAQVPGVVVVAVGVQLPVPRNHPHSHHRVWPGPDQALLVGGGNTGSAATGTILGMTSPRS